jgi:hypothetical protein
MMKRRVRTFAQFVGALLGAAVISAAGAENGFVGEWAFTTPGGTAGWLGVQQAGEGVKGSMLWGFGSVEPVASATVESGKLMITRKHNIERKSPAGKTIKTNITETVVGTLENGALRLSGRKPRVNAQGEDTWEAVAHKQPPMPPTPDLARAKFGEKSMLFNGENLAGWRLTDPGAINGWSVKEGVLVNNPVQEEGKPHKNYGNLRTDREFKDFNLTLEVRLPKGGNSGVYLRGIYEVQMADTYGNALDSHNMGAVYSRITPVKSAEKPFGKWQTVDLTLVNRHVTVVLNGERVIDNQPVLGCTGGALWSDVSRPGPIYLQGDHTGCEYRNIVIREVLEEPR